MSINLRNRPELLFYYRLAEALGKTVQEIMALPATEIVGWEEYYSIYPFPQEREDARTALLAQTVANMSGRMIKDGYEKKIEEFLPDYLDERNVQELSIEKQILAAKKWRQEFFGKT